MIRGEGDRVLLGVLESHTIRCEVHRCLCEYPFRRGSVWTVCLYPGRGDVCLWGVCVRSCVCSVCSLLIACWGGGEVCGCVALSPLACLTKERVGAFCECVWVSVCDAPSIPNSGIKGAGLPLFLGGEGLKNMWGELLRSLSPLHLHVIL